MEYHSDVFRSPPPAGRDILLRWGRSAGAVEPANSVLARQTDPSHTFFALAGVGTCWLGRPQSPGANNSMELTRIESSLVLAAYFRGGRQDDRTWTSNTDQILTLSLFYTDDIAGADCAERFSTRSYMRKLYDKAADPTEHPWGKLTDEIEGRYRILINLLRSHPELIEGAGDFDAPAHPTFTACRLTDVGLRLAETLGEQFPKKPDFPHWPDRRTMPERI